VIGWSNTAPKRRYHETNAITRLVGAKLLEQNDQWTVQRASYLTLETVASTSNSYPPGGRRWSR
jgi:hypothetical protein